MKKLLCIFLTAVVVFSLSACSVFFVEKDQEELITSHESPDGNYAVCLYQVGEPRWSFGSVDAKLVLKDAGGKELDEESFDLSNDGAGVHKGNIIKITWLEDRVEVLMGESDTTKQYTYVLNYSE